ncbi:hypothetical protein BDV33DRAFT_7975 [Aspergillus novoparasiticus]|uniref:BZIP domain-containing protein n=1 Tax=Aspergillus novoparasiticus TaxID=986946 RepID=A0A5N6EDT2_9EURO|nr:hypothetical protein BDV33DRAFT_7975 [Aspergillus novoparasiticus]
MEYPYYPNPQSQPFSLYNLQGAPTLGQNDDDNQHRNPQTDDIQDTLASLSYQSFDPSFRFQNPAASFGHPPHSPPESFSKHSASGSDIFGQPTEPTSLDGEPGFGRSSSEEKDSMTPAQSKRKAQNRAAQRAFRERKERHVRELEEKVNNLEQASSNLVADNERLKQELARFTTENEILRATSGSSDRTHNHSDEPTTTGPLKYTPTDFYSELVPKGEPSRLHRVSTCAKTGEKLLGAGATWDLIQGHELFKRGLVDIKDVSERLKNITQCDGQGPAFPEAEVLKAIEESAAANDDDLL